jgi:hypothetical protein
MVVPIVCVLNRPDAGMTARGQSGEIIDLAARPWNQLEWERKELDLPSTASDIVDVRIDACGRLTIITAAARV